MLSKGGSGLGHIPFLYLSGKMPKVGLDVTFF